MSVSIEEIYPLSPLQQGLLFHTVAEPGSGMYVEQVGWTFHGALAADTYRRAWEVVLERHAVLRTGFVWQDVDRPLQVVYQSVKLPFHSHDWSMLPAAEQDARLRALLEQDGRREFDLSMPPLMRLTLVRLQERVHQFVWTHHHLLLDGWSVPIVLGEIFDIYAALSDGRDVLLPPTRSYREYIAWLGRQNPEASAEYWRRALHDATVPTALPHGRSTATLCDRAEPESRSLDVATATTDALHALGRLHHLTMNTFVQGAWALLLSCHSGEEDVVFGAVVSGRPPAVDGIEAMVGLFINTVPVRVRVRPEAPLIHWLQQLQQQFTEVRLHEHCSLVDIRRWAGLSPDRPLFESLLGFENYPSPRRPRGPSPAADRLELSGVTSRSRTNYPLTIMAAPGPPLALRLLYDTARYDGRMMERLLQQLRTVLEACARNPSATLGDLPIVPDAERDVLIGWSGTPSSYPRDASIEGLVSAQAARAPERQAVVFGDTRLTYGELERRANQLSQYLAARGAGPDGPVAISMARSADLIVSMLAALKTGAPYVPVDPEYPPARQREMVEECGARVLLTNCEPEELRALPIGIEHVQLSRDWPVISQCDDSSAARHAGGDRIAYVMYTSGSTGRPKGIAIPHRGVVRLVVATNYLQLSAADRVAQASNASFDAATFEIWGALLNGGTLVGVTRDEILAPSQLARVIRDRGITVMFLTTAAFNAVAHHMVEAFAPLRCLLFGGETADPGPISAVLAQAAPGQLLHMYGPTESTTFATWYHITSGPDGTTVPIGQPIANTQVWVLDERGRLVPIGAPGEICLAGDGLAWGYLNDAEATAAAFVPNPFDATPGARLYRTGDRGRFTADGHLEFLGRIDGQIKLRGFRVEPAEVEAALVSHPGVREAAVQARTDAAGDRCLVAFVTRGHDRSENEDLQQHLAARLPAFMLPARIVWLDALPLTTNGKIHRQALADLTLPAVPSSRAPVRPRTPMEEQIAEIWADVLGGGQPHVDDRFFDVGGQSLKAMQLVSRIRDTFQVELPIRAVFEHPTIAGLAECVEELLIEEIERQMDGKARDLAPPGM